MTSAYRTALKSFGRRYLELHDEISDLDAKIAALVDDLAPNLIARPAIGYETAAQSLLTAGDNVERLHSDAGFTAICGVSPAPASSGKIQRHRLNWGGDSAAKSALHIIAIGWLRLGPKTQAYMAKRVAQGNSKLEPIRCLKRYISRKFFYSLRRRYVEIGRSKSALDCKRGVQGSQFTSFDWADRLKRAGTRISMDRKRRRLNNIFNERSSRRDKYRASKSTAARPRLSPSTR